MAQFAGVIAAAVTPRGRGGDIDFGAAFELLDLVSRGGVQCVSIFDAAGEYAAFGTEHRSRLVYLGVKRSRVPVLAGVGSATLEDSVSLGREARDGGAAALLLPPPLFFAYDQDDLREYYLQFAAQLGRGIPVILRTPGVPAGLSFETARDLLATGLFAGIADRDAQRWRAAGATEVTVLGCDDGCFPATRESGVPGDILEAACAVPELAAALNRAAVANDSGQKLRLETAWREFVEWQRRFPRPLLVKEALGQRGLKTGTGAIPIAPEKQRHLDCFAEWFRGWFPAVKKLAAHA